MHDSKPTEKAYPTVLEDRTLLLIRANEVLRLSHGNGSLEPAFIDLWMKNIISLSPAEKRAVYDFLRAEADGFRRHKDDALRGLDGRIAAEEAAWYNGCIADREKGADYLKDNFPDFPAGQ